jgi:hypothetical protein
MKRYIQYYKNYNLKDVLSHDRALLGLGLYHPLDDITNPKYKLLGFLAINYFSKEKKALAFNRDRCC